MQTNINVNNETEIWKLMLSQAQHFLKSGALPSTFTNAEQVVAVIQYGRELGIPPMSSTQNILLIKGRPTLSANLIGARLKNFGYDYEVKEYTDSKVEIAFTSPKGVVQTFSYTIDEAKKAGNAGKDNYQKYNKEMLYARCLTRGGRIVAPEVLAGVYAPEEFSQQEEKPEEPKKPEKVEAKVTDVADEVNKKIGKAVITTGDHVQKSDKPVYVGESKHEIPEAPAPTLMRALKELDASNSIDELKAIIQKYPEHKDNSQFKEHGKTKQDHLMKKEVDAGVVDMKAYKAKAEGDLKIAKNLDAVSDVIKNYPKLSGDFDFASKAGIRRNQIKKLEETQSSSDAIHEGDN